MRACIAPDAGDDLSTRIADRQYQQGFGAERLNGEDSRRHPEAAGRKCRRWRLIEILGLVRFTRLRGRG